MLTLPPFKAFLASNIPSVYDNTLSYYDELVKLIAYIEQEVVPNVNANTEGLKQLKSYVDNYFKNLDVQEEINNKLDEMAENGQLVEIIGAYLDANALIGYPSVADLKAAANLIEGSYARTAGYYAPGDGGGALYIITSTADLNAKQELLDSGQYATLVVDKVLNINAFGCHGDGLTDDTTAFQAAVNFATTNSLDIEGEGTYLLSDTITFTSYANRSIKLGTLITSGLGNKPLIKLDHTRYNNITIQTITGEKMNVPDIAGTYNHNAAFLMHGTTGENIKVEKIENFVCGFTLYSTGGSGAEGSYYNRISCLKCDTFYMTHFFTYNGCVNGNTFENTLHYITNWTNSGNYDQYTIVNESTGTAPVYVNNHNTFTGIMVEKIVADDGVYYYVADLSDANSFTIDIDRIEIQPSFDLNKIIKTNGQSSYNLVKFNSGWFAVPKDKEIVGNNNIIVSFNNFKYGLAEDYISYDADAGTLDATNFEYVNNGVSNGHIIANNFQKKARINGVFKAAQNLAAFTNIKFSTLNFKPTSGYYGVGVVYSVDSNSANTIAPIGTIKQVDNSYDLRIRLGSAVSADDLIFIDFETM